MGAELRLTPPYFNIAENRVVTVNATCGEGVAGPETYCKLVGYDTFKEGLDDYVLGGHVSGHQKMKLNVELGFQ